MENQENESEIQVEEAKVEKVSLAEIKTSKEDEIVDKIMDKILKIK